MALFHNESLRSPLLRSDFNSWEEYYDAEDDWYQDLLKVTVEVGNHPLSGRVMKFQTGDGYAEYLVLNDKDGQPEIIHLNVGDGLFIHPALMRCLDWEAVTHILGD
jgi:hypothetical protein